MANITLNVQQRFSNLRKKLDQLGYMQPLSIDSLPLVENLFTDFVWTTDSFRKCKQELDRRMEVRERLDDYIEPFKTDNGRLISENNRLNKKIMETKIQHDEAIRNLQCQICHLEEQKEDLRIFSEQCIERVRQYEIEAKQMVDKIVQLQEKNLQAVVHTPEGKKKSIPYRRQRMDINYFIPRNESSESDKYDSKDHCGTTSKMVMETEMCSTEKLELLDSVTTKCRELTKQLQRANEELELNDRKIDNYCHQIKLYEEEIQRLTRELSGGRTIETLSIESQQKTRDRMIEQLNMQIDLLQHRNDELEKELIRSNSLNIKEGKNLKNKGKNDKTADSNSKSFLEIQNQKLLERIDDLTKRECCLLKELRSANERLQQRKPTDCIPVITEQLEREISALQSHIKVLEDDRVYWRKEAETRNKESHRQKSVDSTERDSLTGDTTDELHDELKQCHYKIRDLTAEIEELKNLVDSGDLHKYSLPEISPVRDRDYEGELKKLRSERDNLQNLLDRFERQMHDIQGNIRVLTQERDMICDKYDTCQKELRRLRESLLQSESTKHDGTSSNQQSLVTQSILRRLEMERDDALSDLHKMTTERDSLRERLKSSTENALSEKARLCQKLEDLETGKGAMYKEKEELIDRIKSLRNRIGELEEHNRQLINKSDSLKDVIEKERSRLQKMSADLQRYESDFRDKEKNESRLVDELKDAEKRIITLQECNDEQGKELKCTKHEVSRLKDIISDVDREKDQMQNEVDAKSEEMRDLKTQLKVKEDALNEVRMNVGSLDQQLKRVHDVNSHRDQEMRALVVHCEQMENDLRHQVSKYDQIKAENSRLESDLMVITKEFHKLESELRDSRRCVDDLKEEREQFSEKLHYCQQMSSDQQQQHSSLLEQYRELSLEHDKLQLSLQQVDGQNEDLKLSIEAMEKVVGKLREQILEQEQEMSSLQSNVQHYEDQITNFNKVMENNEQIVSNHTAEKHELLKELAAMRDLCSRLENGKDGVQRQLTSRMLELEQFKADNSELVKDNEILHEEIDSLQENIKNLETVMIAGREKEFRNHMETQQRIAELETEIENYRHLKAKSEQLSRELSRSCANSNELEAECERLRRQLTSEKFKLEMANQELKRRQRQQHLDEKISSDEIRDQEYLSSSSGIHTGRSFSIHSPTTNNTYINNQTSNGSCSSNNHDIRAVLDPNELPNQNSQKSVDEDTEF